MYIACFSIFLYLFFLSWLDYYRCFTKLHLVEYDFKTLSAGDYTVQFDLKQSQWDYFLKKYY